MENRSKPSHSDAKHFGFFRRTSKTNVLDKLETYPSPKKKSIVTVVPPNAEEYDMTHTRRGRAIVFNHERFKGDYQSSRAGAEHDVNALREQFTILGFNVEIHTDRTKAEIFHELEKVAADNDGDVDCLVVVVMTHGDANQLAAQDTDYRSNKLWETFTADRCPALAGKPKLFFIQACRGAKVDDGVRLAISAFSTQTDASPHISYTVPSWSDILIANATFDGYYAWRSAESGSWFIQALCRELAEGADSREICQILTRVNRRVAISYASHHIRPEMNRKKQMPNFFSTLTRELYLRKKPRESLI